MMASDGSAVMDILRTYKNDIDVILLDVTLPGISSRKIFEEAQRVRPDLKVILTSAYGKETIDTPSQDCEWSTSSEDRFKFVT